MSPQADIGLCVYGAQVLINHLGALEGEMEGVRTAGADIEHIHRMRVATRRLRAALPLFSACLPEKKLTAWEKEIRGITRALGAARDADVQIEALDKFAQTLAQPKLKPGLDRLLLRLRQYRTTLQPVVVKALDRFDSSSTLAGMRAELSGPAAQQAGPPFSQALYLHARDSILPRLDEFLAYDSIVAQVERVTELHAMRIAAKRLRYTLEAFSPLYANGLKPWLPSIRDHQETLGSIHDCDVWTTFLPEFREQELKRVLAFYGYNRPYYRLLPGLDAFFHDRADSRAQLYRGFVPEWEKQQKKRFWQGLVNIIQMPVFRAAGLFPPTEAWAED
jgi:CHAD domain-containing protein